jgi:NitT/TauT family transport system permease protein
MAALAETEIPTRPRSPLRLLGAVSPAVWTIILVLIFWEVAVNVTNAPVYIIPSPSVIAVEFYAYWPRLLVHAGFTVSEVLIGFSLAVLIAVPLAVLITYSRVAERAIYPIIVASQSIPKVALAPLLIAWFGYGITPKIVIVVLLSFFPIVINTTVGLKSSSAEMLYLARSMGSSGWQTFWKFRLPQALPYVFAGLKLATVLSVIGAIVAEFIGADRGLGYLIVIAGANFDIARQFAAIIVISMIGMTFFAILQTVERIAVPWKASPVLAGE